MTNGRSTMCQWWVVPGPDGGVSELREVEVPSAGADEVLVRVAGAAINRGELIGRPALVSTNPKAKPARSGIEFAGEIVAVGEGVTAWSVGDRVMARATGCHAEFVVCRADALMASPAGLSDVEAAAIPNVFVTAHDALVTNANLSATDTLLITAGSSGVGTAALQIARHLGVHRILATTRDLSKKQQLLDLGATEVVDTTNDAWADLVRNQGEVDVVIDQVGGPLFAPCLRTMAVAGRYVTVGRNGGKHADIDLDLVARQRLVLIGVTFRSRTPAESLACSTHFAEQLLPAFETGSLRPVLDKTFPLDDLPAAHAYMQSDRQVGKIVLTP